MMMVRFGRCFGEKTGTAVCMICTGNLVLSVYYIYVVHIYYSCTYNTYVPGFFFFWRLDFQD